MKNASRVAVGAGMYSNVSRIELFAEKSGPVMSTLCRALSYLEKQKSTSTTSNPLQRFRC